jgi:phosphatidylinositol alpha-1,6-mannosyltransferase
VKALLLTSVFPPKKGGSGRWFWELYRRLPEIDVHVVAGDTPGAASFDATAELPIVRIPMHFPNWGLWSASGLPNYVRAWFGVSRAVSRIRPDVIHCGRCLPEGLLALLVKRRRGIPFWCYAHGEELTVASSSKELRWLNEAVIRGADRMVANSRHTRDILLHEWNVPPDRVSVLYPGVDTATFVPASPDPHLRAQLGWSGRRVVLTVGALQKRKGQDMLIRALPAIRRRCPDVLYALIGEGWERGYLDDLVSRLNVAEAVQFRGAPTDAELVNCYQQCDLFALPNRRVDWDFEGLGIVLLEAQACGKAVVTGTSGGTSETVQPSVTGELVPSDTPDRLGETIVELLDDPARRAAMGARGREWVLAHFDWAELSRQALSAFTAPRA